MQFKSESRRQHQGTDIAFLIAEREVELSLKVNNAAYQGKTSHLKNLIKSGADPNRVDYNGRSPLVKCSISVKDLYIETKHFSV